MPIFGQHISVLANPYPHSHWETIGPWNIAKEDLKKAEEERVRNKP